MKKVEEPADFLWTAALWLTIFSVVTGCGNRQPDDRRATVLTGDSPDSYNDTEHPDRVAPHQVDLRFENGTAILPPHSLIVVHAPVRH